MNDDHNKMQASIWVPPEGSCSQNEVSEKLEYGVIKLCEIGSVAWAVCNLSTPLPTFLNQKWGPRPVAVIGILMVGGGLFLCTFSTKIWMIMLFYGVVQGLGLCFIQTVSTQLITSFFKGSALVRACSFCAIGETVGMFALCPVFTIGVTNLGWRLVCQISSLVIITLCLPTCYVLASTSREQLPIEADENQSDFVKEKIESDVLQKGEIRVVRKKDLAHTLHVPAIWIFSLTTILFVLCMAFVMISLVEILVVQGRSVTDSSWFVTIYAMSQTAAKVLNIIIGNRLFMSNMMLTVFMCITGGVMSLGMVYWENITAYIFAYSIVNGLIRGNISSRNLAAAIEVFGQELSPILINFMYISVGVAFLSASLVGGLSYDLTGSYRVAHISIAACWSLAAVLLIPLALGSPSFIFQPWYCCHRDYTTVQSSEDLRHKDTGTSASTYLHFERRDDESSSSKV
ncbi:uncharacterized protein [Apostichopus japonicus]|uniref:uncharacterized protein isoform X2 n=1 Tax=Stichopus japonicus TaxID=307972 RepID=UPI003AB2A219